MRVWLVISDPEWFYLQTGNMEKNYDKADAIERRRLTFLTSLVDKSRNALSRLIVGPSLESMTKVRS